MWVVGAFVIYAMAEFVLAIVGHVIPGEDIAEQIVEATTFHMVDPGGDNFAGSNPGYTITAPNTPVTENPGYNGTGNNGTTNTVSGPVEAPSAPQVDLNDGNHGGKNANTANPVIGVWATGEFNQATAHVDLPKGQLGYLSGYAVDGVVGKFKVIKGPYSGLHSIVSGQYMIAQDTPEGRSAICQDYNSQKAHTGWIVLSISGISCN